MWLLNSDLRFEFRGLNSIKKRETTFHFFAFQCYVRYKNLSGGCPRGVMVKAMDCGIVVCEFVLQLRYYVHFQANTVGKGMNPLIFPAMG